jgi:cell division septum initiation protein DivIVA
MAGREPGMGKPDHGGRPGHEEPSDVRPKDAGSFLAPYILRTNFPRATRGYKPAAVREHLEQIVGWTHLYGIDEIVDEEVLAAEERARRREAAAREEADRVRESGRIEAERRTDEARREAERLLEQARAEAEALTATARAEAKALLDEAEQTAALHRRGKQRLGRPLYREK